MSLEIYRQSTIGRCLIETLEELIREGKYTIEQAEDILTHFDDVIAEQLASRTDIKCSTKAHLHGFRYCENVWTLDVDGGVTFKCGSETVSVDNVKLVCCNAALAHPPH